MGAFLLGPCAAGQIFTPEDFTEEHRAIARTTEEFWSRDVTPELERIWRQDHDAAVRVLRKSAELGLTAALVPEQYGGMELDLVSAMIVAEGIARTAAMPPGTGRTRASAPCRYCCSARMSRSSATCRVSVRRNGSAPTP